MISIKECKLTVPIERESKIIKYMDTFEIICAARLHNLPVLAIVSEKNEDFSLSRPIVLDIFYSEFEISESHLKTGEKFYLRV